jgi:S-adenosylmethionine decarboxylase
VPQTQTGRKTGEIVKHVVDIFKPGRFSVTLFEAKPTIESDSDNICDFKRADCHAPARNREMERIPGYRRVDRIVHDLDGYDLAFRYYERNDWQGGAPRIGENVF